MSDYLAGMTARSEHQQVNESRQPLPDFVQQNVVYTPGWLERSIGTLFQGLSSMRPSLKAPTQQSTLKRDLPLSENSKAIS